ncbi:MAG: hypothetical protein AB7U92_23715, partial [Piscinibacter sp.]
MADGQDVQDICGRLDRGEIDRDQFFDQLTRAVADLIGCTRCGVWVFVDTAEGRALRCMAMYDRRVDRIVGAADIYNADSGPYFDTLVREGCVIASVARAHPATHGVLDDYRLPLDLHSL